MSRSSIRRQIRKKQAELRTCERVKTIVIREGQRMNDQSERWNQIQQGVAQEEMTTEVVVRHCFEGKASKKLRVRLLDGVGYKISKRSSVTNTIEDTKAVRRRIENRIDELEREIDDLYDDLRNYD